jgi:hypothetical protein
LKIDVRHRFREFVRQKLAVDVFLVSRTTVRGRAAAVGRRPLRSNTRSGLWRCDASDVEWHGATNRSFACRTRVARSGRAIQPGRTNREEGCDKLRQNCRLRNGRLRPVLRAWRRRAGVGRSSNRCRLEYRSCKGSTCIQGRRSAPWSPSE